MSIFCENFDVKTASIDQLSFVGDAVYSMLVREYLVGSGLCHSAELHSKSAKMVCAAAQNSAYRKIEGVLTEKEIAVYKRGRNSHNNHKPKRADNADYHSATGFEAMLGYLYLSNQTDRINEIFRIIITE